MFDLSEVETTRSAELFVEGTTPEDLVVNVLSDLLAESEIRSVAFSSFAVSVDQDGAVVGAAGSDSIGLTLKGPPVKAVTYHDLEVTRDARGWYGRVVLDV